jgi:hypothetical protein
MNDVTDRAPPRRVTALHLYPIKSCRGVALREAAVDARGIVGDRRCMVVDAGGRFLTQRERPRMALVAPALDGDRLTVRAPDMPTLAVALRDDGARRAVVIWDDRCEAVDQGDDAAAWLSDFLRTPCRLVRIADDFVRRVDPAYARPDDQVGFADGYPFLLAAEASLADLNARTATPLPMDRFRPNVVVDGRTPYEEDGWTRVRIGGVAFRVLKPCARCPITTVDQRTAARAREPLRALAAYRRVPGRGVMFGQNLAHDAPGTLRVGDAVEVLETVA